MSISTLLSIPDDVFQANLFPLLSINELLKLRRVCRETKHLSEEHLAHHPRSGNVISFWVPDETNPPNDITNLERFLNEETDLRASAARIEADAPIPGPCSRFRLGFHLPKVVEYSQVQIFLTCYANQIKHFDTSEIHLPMTAAEFNFFEQLQNLKYFKVNSILNTFPTGKPEDVVLPQVFRQLNTLKVRQAGCLGPLMLEVCKNVRTLGMGVRDPAQLQRLVQVLSQNEHKKLEFFDMKHFLDFEKDPSVIPILCEMLAKWDNLKFLNVDIRIFSIIDDIYLERLVPKILSLKRFFLPEIFPYKLKPLPNCTTLNLFLSREFRFFSSIYFSEPDDDECFLYHTNIHILPVTFPALKKLELRLPWNRKELRLVEHLWKCVPNIEELNIRTTLEKSIADAAFIGENGDCPFLQLTKLRKLDLGFISMDERCRTVTDESFIRVFCQMELKEFRLDPLCPLVYITEAGIRALSKGPFRDSIEILPIAEWKMERLSRKRAIYLAGLFPCNQHISRESKKMSTEEEEEEVPVADRGNTIRWPIAQLFRAFRDASL